jgi:spermidine/putrescine transport system permease protein
MRHTIKYSYIFFVLLFIYVPIFVLIIYSFNSAAFSSTWQGFTLDWYRQLLKNDLLIEAAINSLTIAFLSSTIASLIGVLAAFSLYRYQFYTKKLIYSLIFILIMVPEIVMGISLLFFYSFIKLKLGFFTLLFSHITLCLPFVILVIYARLLNLEKNLVEAASDLGANEWQSFLFVIFPLLMPAFVAGWLLSFTLSMDDVLISFFVTGPGFDILPLRIYSMVRLGIKPEVNALSTFIFIFTLLLVTVAHIFLRKEKI